MFLYFYISQNWLFADGSLGKAAFFSWYKLATIFGAYLD